MRWPRWTVTRARKYVADVRLSPDAQQTCQGYFAAVSHYPPGSITASCAGAIRLATSLRGRSILRREARPVILASPAATCSEGSKRC